MKSVDYWIDECEKLVNPSDKVWRNFIKQIQLDAMKEGMRRAAIVTEQHRIRMKQGELITASHIHQAILTAAEQLTDKDL